MKKMRYPRFWRFSTGRGRRLLPAALATALAAATPGCRTSLIDLNPVRTSVRRFDLGGPCACKPAEKHLPYVLAVEPLVAVAPLDARFAIRTGPNEVRPIAGSRWRERPELLTTAYIQDCLARSGMFRAVVPVGSGPAPDLVLSGVLQRFEWRKSDGKTAAVVEVSVQVRRVSSGAEAGPGALVYSKVLEATVPAKSTAPADLAEAVGRSVSDLCCALQEDLASRLAPGSEAGGVPPRKPE